jgi:thiamine pyrophosphate-dependent acetolactate synthase large subunit-like protein
VATVRDAMFDVLRRYDLTKIFANPGSTEIALFTDLPDDLEFVLALHEGSVVGMATGLAIAEDRPVLVVLHTTAGFGNGVGALATARANRAPLVVIVGQQDRRHLALVPFLTGRLEGLAGDYPVWFEQPARAQDVPGAVARAWFEARDARGPAVVVVPQDDWLVEFDETTIQAAPNVLHRGSDPDEESVHVLAEMIDRSTNPALVVGAGADTPEAWEALVALAETLDCPVWQEAFGARAGFPQNHPLFAGHLPSIRTRLRSVLDGHDLVLAVGAAVFRQYPYDDGPLVNAGTTVAVVTDDADEAHRSPADLVVLCDPAAAISRLKSSVTARTSKTSVRSPNVDQLPAPGPGEPMLAAHVLTARASRLPANTVVVEETPSSRPDLHRLLPAREPLGFLSAAMGGLGFGLPAAVGVRMAKNARPVVAVLGDGSSMYGIQALWSAAHYGVGVLFVVLANGRYAIMDRLAEQVGDGRAPWPAFEEISVSGLAQSFGCPAQRVETHEDLLAILDDIIPTLAARAEPLVLEVAVIPNPDFEA